MPSALRLLRLRGSIAVRSAALGAPRFFGEMTEFGDDALVDLAFEGHDELRELAHLRPPPLHEFRLVAAARMLDVDLGIVARETQRVPFLSLAAVASTPSMGHELVGEIIGQPLAGFREQLDGSDVGFLAQLAKRRAIRVLTRVEAP